MRILRSLDVYFARIQYTWQGRIEYKMRPVVVLDQQGSKAQAFKVSSQYSKHSYIKSHYYYKINGMRATHLYKQSYVDLYSVVTIPLSYVSNWKGHLDHTDKVNLVNKAMELHHIK